MIKWHEDWAEILALAFLALGLVLSVLLRNSILSYISIFLAGLVAARNYYLKRYKEPIFPFILMIIGFLVGYMVGAFWVSRLLALLFFVLGFGVSYYLHLKEILATFKSERFIK